MAVHHNDNDSSLEKHQLVTIDGLQSEAGQKINGGLGILLNVAKEVNGTMRCPVRIFALKNKNSGGYSLDENPKDKMLKMTNAKMCSCKETDDKEVYDIFQKALYERINAAQQAVDNETAIFWLASSYKSQPEVLHYCFSYSNAMSIQGKHEEAAIVSWEFLEASGDLTGSPQLPFIYKEFVSNFCGAKKHLDKALELALAIPADTPENEKISEDALVELANTCKRIIVGGHNIGVEETAQINLKAAKALIQHGPTNPIYREVLGAAYSLSGNNWEGVKWYRKAVEGSAKESHMASSLILAQLQCPGMPLEGYTRLGSDGRVGTFIHHSDLKHVEVEYLPGSTGTQGAVTCKSGKPKVIQFPLPDDPDDPVVFASILEKLKSEEGEVEMKLE